MPVSLVVGGQYGSEGKGKVALELTRRDRSITTAVRPGGTNSGHTGFNKGGSKVALRQLPAAAIDGDIDIVLPAGSYIDPDLFVKEVDTIGVDPSRIHIDAKAQIIRPEHVQWEEQAGLDRTIGSTRSGTGASVLARFARYAPCLPIGLQASECELLRPFISDCSFILQNKLARGERVLVEGTQGFGLSGIHSDAWPKATSRDTTASGFLSECGLSPFEVDDIVLVIRCHPIRVAGDSGPLVNETSWNEIADTAGAPTSLLERTTVTGRVRRVGHFETEVVKRAIAANKPTRIVLNHLDYVDWDVRSGRISEKARNYLELVEKGIGARIWMVGIGEEALVHVGAKKLVQR